MILVALFVMIGGTVFVGVVLWGLSKIIPLVAAKLRISEAKLAAVCALLLLVTFGTYAEWRVECPFCHAGHVDAHGRCALGEQCSNYCTPPQRSQMSDNDRSVWTGIPGHIRVESCPWCGHTGKMSRIAIWMD